MMLSHAKLKRKRKEEIAALVASGDVIPISPIESENGKVTEKKNKNKKVKIYGTDHVDVVTPSSNGRGGENEKQEELGSSKKKKKKMKAASVETNGINHVDIRTDKADNGSVAAEQPFASAAVNERPVSVREKKGKKKSGKDRWGAKIPETAQTEDYHLETGIVTETQPENSSKESYDPKKVVVGGMPYFTTEEDIQYFFSECGFISELDCMTFPDTGRFRGIAFITFQTEEGANEALKLDGEDMGGRFLKIDRCKVKPRAITKDPERGEVQKTPGCLSAYIGNLAWDITEDAIKSFFQNSYRNSKIDSIRLAFDKVTGEFKGFGHVDFGDDESLEAAVKLNQKDLLGRPLKIAYSVPPKRLTDEFEDKSEIRKPGACYVCGEEGHKSFLCPNKGKTNGSKDKKYDNRTVGACYHCGEEGHKSYLCPKKG